MHAGRWAAALLLAGVLLATAAPADGDRASDILPGGASGQQFSVG
jgi:hypothetical protein